MAESMCAEIKSVIEQATSGIYGEFAVNIGDLAYGVSLPETIARHRLNYSSSLEYADIVGEYDELPFLANSVDLVSLTLTLDYVASPHRLLREINRCITADGVIIITAFNPWSIPSLLRYLPMFKSHSLRKARFIPQYRLLDWLRLLDFEVQWKKTYLVSDLLVANKQWIPAKYSQWWEQYAPGLGAVYTVIARKRTNHLIVTKAKFSNVKNLGQVVGRFHR